MPAVCVSSCLVRCQRALRRPPSPGLGGASPEGDGVLGRLEDGLLVVVVAQQDLGILPLREEFGDVVVQGQEPLLDALEGCDGCDELRAGGYPVERIDIGWFAFRTPGLLSKRLKVVE